MSDDHSGLTTRKVPSSEAEMSQALSYNKGMKQLVQEMPWKNNGLILVRKSESTD